MNPISVFAGAALLAIAAYFGGIHVGKRLDHEAWQKEKIALQDRALADVQAEVNKRDRDRKFYEANARKASENYENQIAKNAASYDALRRASSLRIPTKDICPGIAATGQAASASGPNEAGPATVELPEAITGRLLAMTERADALAEQLRGLQGWVVDNGLYGEPKQ